jgi:hypothetical protein
MGGFRLSKRIYVTDIVKSIWKHSKFGASDETSGPVVVLQICLPKEF